MSWRGSSSVGRAAQPSDRAGHLATRNAIAAAPAREWPAVSTKLGQAGVQLFNDARSYAAHGAKDIRFLTLQIFAVIYLQKLAIGPANFQLSVPMLIMLGSLAWRAVSGTLAFAPLRLAIYLCFIGLSVAAQSFLPVFSAASLMDLIVLSSFFTIRIALSERDLRQVLGRFVTLMVLPAWIIIFQFAFQKLTGQPDPLNMNHMLPAQSLAQGYFYAMPYQFGFAFTRPNGFFFLEPSYASLATAAALIIELTFFRRSRRIMLMLMATVLSLGGTGITMLIVAAPFLLVREKPHVVALILLAVVAGLAVAYVMDLPLPLISRLNELNTTKSSGADRLAIPFHRLFTLLADPSYLLSGIGAGAVSKDVGSFWPIVKLLNEYGFLVMATYVALYMTGLAGQFNFPLKIALSVVFNFTGAYLLQPTVVEYVALFCFIIQPAESAGGLTVSAASEVTVQRKDWDRVRENAV